MSHSPVVDILTHGLRELVGTMSDQNPNRASLNEALRYTESSQADDLLPVERTTLIRLAAAHMRRACLHSEDAMQECALATARRAMTAALFECCAPVSWR